MNMPANRRMSRCIFIHPYRAANGGIVTNPLRVSFGVRPLPPRFRRTKIHLRPTDTLTAAIAAFGKVMNTPRGQIVNKSALLREVETDTAALVQLATDMDDLALQFDGTDAGKRFIDCLLYTSPSPRDRTRSRM